MPSHGDESKCLERVRYVTGPLALRCLCTQTIHSSTCPRDRESRGRQRAAPPRSNIAGAKYMFPVEHTTLHIFNRAAPIWESKYSGQKLEFNMNVVGIHLTVREVIQNTMRGKVKGEWERCNGWAATEVIECGDGRWAKGSTMEYSTDRATRTLENLGWTEKRGKSMQPVWITVHKV